MPEISRFFGIVIYMNWREHPPMHFHAVYGEHEALMTLDGKVYAGSATGPGVVDGSRMDGAISGRN
ncbi:DUF4160 domain-containing protein [Accumulibacter sp.]|uniref:DUF4160 domain-containing protein n=1 Tax=Accumulibacter sp. TaxID=2053492 RepID=UPI0026298E3A|nr:DUF4160 domain-containing protein [Accumulibacter sp.]